MLDRVPAYSDELRKAAQYLLEQAVLTVPLAAESLSLELDVAPRQPDVHLAGEQVGVRTGDEDGEATLDVQSRVMALIYKQPFAQMHRTIRVNGKSAVGENALSPIARTEMCSSQGLQPYERGTDGEKRDGRSESLLIPLTPIRRLPRNASSIRLVSNLAEQMFSSAA